MTTSPARQTGPETPTIECEACLGTGVVWGDDEHDWVDCNLCSGTGREPSTVQPREPK